MIDVLGQRLNITVRKAYNFVSALSCITVSVWYAPFATTVPIPCATRDEEFFARQRPRSGRMARLRLSARAPAASSAAARSRRGHGVIHELLGVVSWQAILARGRPPRRKLAQQGGMQFLRESAVGRVVRGLTTLKEANKVTFVEAFR